MVKVPVTFTSFKSADAVPEIVKFVNVNPVTWALVPAVSIVNVPVQVGPAVALAASEVFSLIEAALSVGDSA